MLKFDIFELDYGFKYILLKRQPFGHKLKGCSIITIRMKLMKDKKKEMIESFIQSTIDKVPGGHCEGLFKLYGGDISNPTLIRVSVAKKGQSKSWIQTMNDYMKHIRDEVPESDFDYTRQGRVAHYGIEIYKKFEGVIWYEFEPMPTASALDIKKTYQHNKVDLLSQFKDKQSDLKVA